MDTNRNSRRSYTVSIKTLLLQYLIAIILSILFAIFLHKTLINYLNIYHTVLELICVYISLSIFISVWFTYNKNSINNYILGFGYLAVAVFDVLHTFYHLKLDLNANSYFDLSTRYWVLGRISEAVVLLLSVQSIKIKLSKWLALSITLIISLGAAFIVNVYHDYLPVLLNQLGVTPIKVVLEYFVIAIFLYTLYTLKDKINDRYAVTNKYIFIALILAISSEFCFTQYITVNSIIWTIGHVLKITTYFYLFKGIFISTVTYPYEKLEDEHMNLDTAYKELDEAHIQTNYLTDTLNSTLDALPVAVLKCGFDRRMKYINRKFEELLACNRNNLYGHTLEELLSIFLEDGNGKQLIERLIESEADKKNTICVFKTMEGEDTKLSITTQKIADGIIILLKDVKKEQELENVHLQTQTILNALSNCVLMIDNDRKIILCNKALEEVFEIEGINITGMDLEELNELVDFGTNELFDLILKDDIKKQFFEITLVSMKGNKKELLMCFTSIRNVEGEIIGGISVSTDITNLKKEQQKMVQQEKLALLGQMGAGIVHETRNYLTTIKGRCYLIDMLSQDENIKAHTAKISSDIEDVNKIISEFLFLSKPRQAQMEEISLNDIFASIKGMIETSSIVKGIDVYFNLSKEERYLLCDEAQIKQVILNICKNAIDAMSDVKDAKLKIDTGYNEQTNEMFVKISDNGKGISKEDLGKIGTVFFTTKKSGTGLGLNVCYQIINHHKGKINVESEVGEGTSFVVILPCIEDDEDEFEAI